LTFKTIILHSYFYTSIHIHMLCCCTCKLKWKLSACWASSW